VNYITKPFSVRELMARVRAMVRRSHWMAEKAPGNEPSVQPVLKADNLEVDVSGHRVINDGAAVNLSPKEFGLLAFLMRHRGQVFNREQLVEQIWGYDFGGTARTVDVHILSLRRKIGDTAEKPEHLLTVHGIGYKFVG
jgi:DNA-binding response OmpR family regulator